MTCSTVVKSGESSYMSTYMLTPLWVYGVRGRRPCTTVAWPHQCRDFFKGQVPIAHDAQYRFPPVMPCKHGKRYSNSACQSWTALKWLNLPSNFSPPGSSITLVFWNRTLRQYANVVRYEKFSIFNKQLAISQKWYKTCTQLQWNTNKQSYTIYQNIAQLARTWHAWWAITELKDCSISLALC